MILQAQAQAQAQEKRKTLEMEMAKKKIGAYGGEVTQPRVHDGSIRRSFSLVSFLALVIYKYKQRPSETRSFISLTI